MRDLFVQALLDIVPNPIDLQMLVNGIVPGAWNDVPIGATPRNAANVLVDLAMHRGWALALLTALQKKAPASATVPSLIALLAAQPAPTAADPFDEVWLEGDRPFVNRRELRDSLKLLCRASGSTLLLVGGKKDTGKSFSFYLAQHAARPFGFISSQFEVKRYVQPDELAAAILECVGASAAPCGKGAEQAERWAEKLAAQVKDAIFAGKLQRLFVFDAFPATPLPDETRSFLVRLARYADQELRPWLRIVLIEFPGELPGEIDDVAERDEAQPFTGTDMLALLTQIARARNWSVSEQALQAEIQQLEAKEGLRLRDRFQFLRKTVRTLAKGRTP